MELVLWLLKKDGYIIGDPANGDPVVMKAISSDRCPIGYKGVSVYVKNDVLEKRLTKEFLKEIGND